MIEFVLIASTALLVTYLRRIARALERNADRTADLCTLMRSDYNHSVDRTGEVIVQLSNIEATLRGDWARRR